MNLEMEEIDTQGDEWGFVFEPLEPDALPRQRNVHVVITRPGYIRGNHYYRGGMEVIVVKCKNWYAYGIWRGLETFGSDKTVH